MANMTIVDRDPFESAPEELRKLRVVQTIRAWEDIPLELTWFLRLFQGIRWEKHIVWTGFLSA